MAHPDQPGLDLARIFEDADTSSPAARDQAADLVQGYVQEQATSALDTLLAAADAGHYIRRTAVVEADAASRMVNSEVARFRDLDTRRG